MVMAIRAEKLVEQKHSVITMTTSRKKLHNKWHKELSRYWQGREITYCELRFKGCWGTYGLAPAHSKRRRLIETKEEYFEVVAACKFCHDTLDQKMSHEECLNTVRAAIRRRANG